MKFLFSFCRFPDTSEQLRKPKMVWFEAEKLAVTGEKISRLSPKEKFLDPIEKKCVFHYTSKKLTGCSSSHRGLHFEKQSSGGLLWKKVFLKISQNCQENIRVRASFLTLQASNTFFIEHLRWLLLDFQRKCHGKLESIKNRTERFISQLYNALALLLACLEYWECR